MGRPVSELLKNFGKLFEVVKALVNAVLDAGGTDEDVLRILKDKKLARKFAEIVMEGRVLIAADGCEFVFVNYDLSLEQAIAAATFGWKNSDITPEHFPNAPYEQGSADVETKLYHFGKDMSSDKVVAEMDKDGFRPATLRELLAFAVKNPDEQRKYAIVGLGSVWGRGGNRGVPYLGLRGSERGLDLDWWSDYWSGNYRFLAVRKS